MAEDYGKVLRSFWNDPKICRLSVEGRLLLLYFFTSPHGTMTGLYTCPLAYAANETGLEVAVIQGLIAGELQPFLAYDATTREVLVFRGTRHGVARQVKEDDKRLPKVRDLIRAAHSPTLKTRWATDHREWVVSRMGQFMEALPGLSEAPSGRPLTPSNAENTSDTGSPIQPDHPGQKPHPASEKGDRTGAGTGTGTGTPAGAAAGAAAGSEVRAIRELLPEPYRPDFDDILRRTPNTRAFCADLRATQAGMPGHGPGCSWEIIGHALHDIEVAGAPASARAVRRFCEDLVSGKSAAPIAPDGTTEFSALLEAAARSQT